MTSTQIAIALYAATFSLANVTDNVLARVQCASAQLPTGDSIAPERSVQTQPNRLSIPLITAEPPCSNPIDTLILPSTVRETSGFGLRRDPLGGGIHLHAGIDLAAPTGTSVTAAGVGEVLRSGWAQGYGNLVIIDHGQGLTTRYAHLERSLVHLGQEVGAGQLIGLVGATGHATGSHLHFEIRKSGMAVDPLHAAMTCTYSDAPPMLPALGAIAARSDWSAAGGNDALPTIVMR